MIQEIWQQFLSLVSQEVGSRVVETWFKVIGLHHWDEENGIAYLEAPNQFVCDWVRSNYLSMLETHLARLLHATTVRVHIQVHGTLSPVVLTNHVFIPTRKEKN